METVGIEVKVDTQRGLCGIPAVRALKRWGEVSCKARGPKRGQEEQGCADTIVFIHGAKSTGILAA